MSDGFGIAPDKISPRKFLVGPTYEGLGVIVGWEPQKASDVPIAVRRARTASQFRKACNALVLSGEALPDPRSWSPNGVVFWWRGQVWIKCFCERRDMWGYRSISRWAKKKKDREIRAEIKQLMKPPKSRPAKPPEDSAKVFGFLPRSSVEP